LDWAPVFLALALFAQVAIAGLQPALREARRLDAEELQLLERHEELEQERQRLVQTLEAFGDPVFQERERRCLLDPAGPGLSPAPGAPRDAGYPAAQ
jgi:hypothetical protein